jgi:hypothetical protein
MMALPGAHFAKQKNKQQWFFSEVLLESEKTPPITAGFFFYTRQEQKS